MKFTEREDFKQDMEKYMSLTNRVKDLAKQAASTPEANIKTFIFNQIILLLNDFDNHILYMSKQYPDYYDEYKAHVNDLHKDNVEYIQDISIEIRKLNKNLFN